jgi:hypothetical protein
MVRTIITMLLFELPRNPSAFAGLCNSISVGDFQSVTLKPQILLFIIPETCYVARAQS